jgi:kynureninase
MARGFAPTPGADGWQLSNPPILGLAPLRASLEQFDRVGMHALRASLDQFDRVGMRALRPKSQRLTGYLEALIRERLGDTLQIVTPREQHRRGAQLSLRVAGGHERGRALFDHLAANGVLGDWREPDVIRISPAPLYNTHADVLRFVRQVESWRGSAA